MEHLELKTHVWGLGKLSIVVFWKYHTEPFILEKDLSNQQQE
jgi:hypothetical protein